MFNHNLYFAAKAAEDAWQAALVKLYGKRAGDARYDGRGQSTPELQVLYAAKRTADEAWLAHMRLSCEKS